MNHRPRKRFGQHFLHDPGVIARIVAAIDPKPDERLLEIGPGRGALTVPLLQRAGRLAAVELDRDVIPLLEQATAGLGELTIHQADALRFDYGQLASPEAPLRLVGNLPYNISTPLLFHVLRYAQSITDMHFMLQKEVVDRMAATPGGKTYGRLTVMLAAVCRIEPLFDIGPGAFTPPPAVRSSMVRLTPWQEPPFEIADQATFAALVKEAFSKRRKILRNALRAMLEADQIEAAGCNPGARPETLAPAEFAHLSNRVVKR